MASPAQNAYANSVPLPQQNPNAMVDPNGFLPTGAALSALDPNDPAATQPVGSAMDTVAGQEDDPYDAVSAQLAAGKRIRITSQAQWNAMSPHEKEVVRAAMATGGQMRAGDAVRIYQDSVKRARANQVQTVTTSDGRKVDMVNGQMIPAAKQEEPMKREIRETADGLRAIDPLTGESFQVYDKYTGSAVTGKPKISEDNRVQYNQANIELDRIQSQLNQLNSIPEGKYAVLDDSGNWTASNSSWGTKYPQDVKAELLKKADLYSDKIRRLDPTNAVSKSSPSSDIAPAATRSATPSSTPRPTPTPNPMPTPDKFVVGKPYRDKNGNKAIYRGNGVFE